MPVTDPIVYYSYSNLLDDLQLEYVEQDTWLYCGIPDYQNNWTVYVSCRTLKSIDALLEVLPILKKYGPAFRLIKDDTYSYKLNSGELGPNEVGKFLSIYTNCSAQAIEIVNALKPVLQDYLAPEVLESVRIDKNIYAHYTTTRTTEQQGTITTLIDFYVPDKKTIPFKLNSAFKSSVRKKLYGKYYLKMKILRPGPKGEIVLAYSFKKFAFKPVVIKEGRYGALEDPFGRDIKDRLQWQKKVLMDIGNSVPTAQYLDLFEENGNYFLVIEYLDGTMLADKLDQIKNFASWKDLTSQTQYRILYYYLQIIRIVKKVHQLGYIHRDIQDNNFMVAADERISIVDFELAYNENKQEPATPFPLGTFGYSAPEQIRFESPIYKSDVFSLGALLAFILTGEHPSAYIGDDSISLNKRLLEHSNNHYLTNLIQTCLDESPMVRPEVEELEGKVSLYLNNLNGEHSIQLQMKNVSV